MFHYTRRKKHLVAMLKDGIWPRFSEEEFTWLDDAPELYLASPMVCFCDIPIRAAKDHREKYGYYAVAIHENYTEELDLTPVWYIRDNGPYAKALRRRFPGDQRFTLQQAKHCDLFQFLPFVKITIGVQPILQKNQVLDFIEECEWRHIPKSSSSDD